MTYDIILAPQPQKFLKNMKNKRIFLQIEVAFTSISLDPKKGKQLVGALKGLWSWRVSSYRILYEIQEQKVIVYILRISHRKKVYE